MKLKILFCLCLCSYLLLGQSKDSIISEAAQVHVFKPQKVAATPKAIKSLKLPAGFKINVFASNLGKPRMMVVHNNQVYVSRRSGEITMLTDTNNDGKADTQKTVITKKGVHGLAIHEDTLYIITVNDVFKGLIHKDGTIGDLKTIITNLPDGGQHPNRTLAIGPDGKLYISIGSDCNACAETREESATLLQFDTNGKNKKIFAKGLRNTIGFDWEPKTQKLYGMDHGIDWLGDDIQKEELNLIEEGNDYGWPYIYGKGNYNKADQPKNMTYKEYSRKSTHPVMEFTAHSAPMNLLFYKGTMFPKEYQNAAFITFHGSWNRKDPKGYKVMHLRFNEGTPVKATDFITAFLSTDGRSFFGRPVGLAELPDGSLLLSDDSNGVIYRITYSE